MPKIKDHRAVEVDFATTGPNRTTHVQHIDAPASTAFEVLADGPAWKEWLGIEVEWTSPEPFGVGTTRTVRTKGQTLEETFLAWEGGRRMNFRFERSTMPVSAMAEDYLLVDRGADRCTLEWSYAYEWAAPLGFVTQPIFSAVFGKQARDGLKKFAAIVESRR